MATLLLLPNNANIQATFIYHSSTFHIRIRHISWETAHGAHAWDIAVAADGAGLATVVAGGSNGVTPGSS